MIRLFITTIILFLTSLFHLQAQEYKLVVYNVENLFDADGYAVFEDYRPFDSEGNLQYTPAHILTKIQKTTRLMARYNNGEGPDIIMLVELESDYTPLPEGESYNIEDFLNQYREMHIEDMLGDAFNDEIGDLPSELLLLKGFEDYGLTGYDLAVAYDRDETGRPRHVQKNVTYSRLPIMHEKTRSHPIEDARPILETWINVDGYELVLFNNHWKSRASDPEMEKIRVQNATVLRNRLDEILAENKSVDFVLGGDFNSDYNQSHRYDYMEVTAVNDILRSTGDERKVKQGDSRAVYNLWYEHDINQRGSDTFRGYWGTLMQIMISSGLYDYHGFQYVDNSFDVGRFPGKNVYANSGAPRRWSAFGTGSGYSDHLPISMKLIIVEQNDPDSVITLQNPGYVDDATWSPIPVTYHMPNPSDVVIPQIYGDSRLTAGTYYGQLLWVESEISSAFTVEVNGETFGLWAPGFNIRNRFSDTAGTGEIVTFIGRLGIFRGNWQFVIEDEQYINPEW